MPTFALDAMPLAHDPRSVRDHAGLAVAAWVSAPLVEPSVFAETTPPRLGAARAVEVDPAGRVHTFTLDERLRWSDGAPARAADFAAAIAACRDAATPERFWLRDLRRVDADGQRLVIETGRPWHRFAAVTGLPMLRPGRPDAALGRCAVTRWDDEQIELSPNPHWPRPVEPPRWKRVRSPEANWDAYHRGEVDLTAETAFPYDRVPQVWSRPDFHVVRSGVFVALGFGGRLVDDAPMRVRVAGCIDRDAICRDLGGVLVPRDRFVPTPHLREAVAAGLAHGRFAVPSDGPAPGRAPLRLAYDPYYPNLELARIVAAQLRRGGLEVELCEDSFERPFQVAEVRLVLSCALRSGELGLYHGWLFDPILRADRADLAAYLQRLHAFDATPDPTAEQVASTAAELQVILDRRGVAVPLAEVPGLCLSRDGVADG